MYLARIRHASDTIISYINVLSCNLVELTLIFSELQILTYSIEIC